MRVPELSPEEKKIAQESFKRDKDLFAAPVLVDVYEYSDRVELIYAETSIVIFAAFPAPSDYNKRIFKIIYSCVNGQWSKSERIYGKVIPAKVEAYEFE